MCRLFKEKIVNGQLCYEANIRQFRNVVNWEEALRQGLSFVIDTTEEYDVKNLMQKKPVEETNNVERLLSFQQIQTDNSFTVLLETINPVPIVLQGEGNYELTAIKEIKVTKDFLGLGGEVTQCQTKEYRADCQSRRHRQQVLATCGCAPFSMMSYYGQQTRVCSPTELDCVDGLELDTSDCLEKCEGNILDVVKLSTVKSQAELEQFLSQYENFKNPDSDQLEYPNVMKDLEFRNKLKFVQISFSTSTFDRITKDRAAKFVDQLSAIGGTMGLLTGFSLISAVEIIYFMAKMILRIMKKNHL